MTLKDKVKQGFSEAFSTRGKRKGLLKAKCPPMNTYGASVWQAIMSHSNPYKVGFGHLIFMDADHREVYRYVSKCGEHIDLTTFDLDRNNLESIGIY